MLKQTDKVLTGKDLNFLSSYTLDVNVNRQIITGQFAGGNIRSGKMIGVLDQNRIVSIRYTYVTVLNEFRSGNTAFPLTVSEDALRICDAWNWLGLKQREESLTANDEVKRVLAGLLRKSLA